MELSALIEKMFIFVVLMLIGYFCTRTGYLGKAFAADASRLVVNVFMSATIVNSGIADEMMMTGGEIAQAMLVLCVTIVICQLVGSIACRVLPLDKEKAPLFELLTAVMNNVFIAMPVLDTLFGTRAVLYCSLSCLPFNVLLYTYGTARLQSTGGKGVRLKDIFSMPLIATFIAMFLLITRLPLPGALRSLIGAMADATMPMSMIVIGASLGSVSLFDALKDWRLYAMSALRLIVCPILVYFVVGFMTQDFVLLVSAVVIAACPSAVVVSVLTIQYGKDAVFTSEGILLSTVLSMLTIPVTVYLLQ